MSKILRMFSLVNVALLLIGGLVQAGTYPKFSIIPITPTSFNLPFNESAMVSYVVTNNTKLTRTLVMEPILGITQSTNTFGSCQYPFTLISQQSCILTLNIIGNQLPLNGLHGKMPKVCKILGPGNNNPDPFLCSQANPLHALNITVINELLAEITANPNPLVLLTRNTKTLTITNTSSSIIAHNIHATLPANWTDVIQDASDCINVAPGASCQLRFTAGTTRYPEETIIVQGDNTNALAVILSVKQLFAYVSNDFSSGADNITRCEVLQNGDFASCQIAASGFRNPFGMTTNPSQTLVYVSNNFMNTGNVLKCAFTANDDLACSVASPVLPVALFFGITFNPSGTLIYVTRSSSSVLRCSIDNVGNLFNCANTTAGVFTAPLDTAFNQAGTTVYISEFFSGITRCDVDVNGDFLNCAATGSGFISPVGIALNNTETRAYVVNGQNNLIGSVSKCDIVSGNLVNCAIMPMAIIGITSRYIVFNENESLAYITNAVSDNVSKCEVDPVTGDFFNCTFTGTNMNGATGLIFVAL